MKHLPDRSDEPLAEPLSPISPALSDEMVLKAIAPFRQKKAISASSAVFKAVIRRLGYGTCRSDAALLTAQHMPNLTPRVQKQALRALGSSLDIAASLLLKSANPSDREGAVETLFLRRSPSTMRHLVGLTRDETRSVREKAVESIVTLCRTAPKKSSLWNAMDQSLASLVDAVEVLPDRTALRCALPMLAGAGPHLSRILDDGGHPANMVFRSLVRRQGPSLGGRELVRLLGVEAVAPAAFDALQSVTVTVDDWGSALSVSHLLLTPIRRTRITRMARGDRRLPAGSIIDDLPSSSIRSFPRWLAANCWDEDGLTLALDRLIACDDPAARAVLVAQLRHAKRPASTIRDALMDLSFDRSPAVARSALLSLLDEDSREMRKLIRRQRQSQHRANRMCEAQIRRRRDPWASLDHDDALADATALRLALRRNRAGAIRLLQQGIANGPPRRRIRAIALAIRVGATLDCELELLATAASHDSKLAASGVLALGRLTTSSAIQAVRACLSHSDDRVRANAVEAATKHDSLIEPVCASLDSSVAREKCNAVHVLLSRVEPKLQSQGRSVLEDMLADERADHRRSALWLVERLGCTEVAARVASLVSNDCDQAVRTRAGRTARRLLAEMRAGSALCLNADHAASI